MQEPLTAREIIYDIRPLAHMSDRELSNLVMTAFFMAEQAEASDSTSLSTRAIKLAAARMVEGATLELSYRN